MPVIRQSLTNPLHCAAELLSHLQLAGHLDHLEVPAWARDGTGVEELILALRMLGDGRWLAKSPEDRVEPLADRWVEDFLRGQKVASPYDGAGKLDALLSTAAGVDLHESVGALRQYLQSLSDEMRARFAHRAQSELSFARAALVQMDGLSLTLASCGVSPDDGYDEEDHACLRPEAINDPDLLAMALKLLEDDHAFDAMGAYGAHFVAQGERRALALSRRLRSMVKLTLV